MHFIGSIPIVVYLCLFDRDRRRHALLLIQPLLAFRPPYLPKRERKRERDSAATISRLSTRYLALSQRAEHDKIKSFYIEKPFTIIYVQYYLYLNVVFCFICYKYFIVIISMFRPSGYIRDKSRLSIVSNSSCPVTPPPPPPSCYLAEPGGGWLLLLRTHEQC